MEFKLFVRNIPFRYTEKEFLEIMKRIEGVKEVQLITRKTGIGKGYGFVTFTSDAYKNAILNNNNGIVIDGRTLKFEPYENQHKFYKLHVTNVPEDVTSQLIFDFFSKFGKIDSVKRDFDVSKNRYKGSAVVVVDNYEDFHSILQMGEIKYNDGVTFGITKRRTNRRFMQFQPVRRQYVPRTYVPRQYTTRQYVKRQ